MNDPLTERLQERIGEIERSLDPDDSEIEGYARLKNGIQTRRDMLDIQREREIASIEANYVSMQKAITSDENDIEWLAQTKWNIPGLVHAKIKNQKLRSVKTLFGTVGYRKQAAKVTRNIRCDNATLLAWAEEHCPDAVVSRTNKSVSKGELPETCEHMWIENVPETDTFYWKPAKAEVQEKPNDRQE